MAAKTITSLVEVHARLLALVGKCNLEVVALLWLATVKVSALGLVFANVANMDVIHETIRVEVLVSIVVQGFRFAAVNYVSKHQHLLSVSFFGLIINLISVLLRSVSLILLINDLAFDAIIVFDIRHVAEWFLLAAIFCIMLILVRIAAAPITHSINDFLSGVEPVSHGCSVCGAVEGLLLLLLLKQMIFGEKLALVALVSVKWTNVISLRAQLVRPEIITRLQRLLLQRLQKVECLIRVTWLHTLTHTQLVNCVRKHRVAVDRAIHGNLIVR